MNLVGKNHVIDNSYNKKLKKRVVKGKVSLLQSWENGNFVCDIENDAL